MNDQSRLSIALLTFLTLVATALLASAEDWPQWRGPQRNDLSQETGLLQSWPEGGPKRVWLYENAGQGYSGPAIAGGKFVTMGTRDNREAVLALDANSGRELWTAPVGDILDNQWGDGPRSTPTIHDGLVYALSGKGSLVCLQADSGRQVWEQSLTKLGGDVPGWGYTESVLVDQDRVLCTPGGSQGALAALDRKTGRVLWQSTGFTDGAQYASPITANWNGARQYIQLTMKTLVGVAADDGRVLWESDWPGRTAVIPTPIFHDGHVYITSGYGVGCKLVKLNAGHMASDVYENRVMKNHHGGVILYQGHVYGHSDGYAWVCQNFLTGEEVWSSRRVPGALGKGAIGYADGRFYCLEEDSGKVALIEASTAGWKAHGQFTLNPQSKIRSSSGRIWTHPVVANGKLYLRDQDLIYCFDVKQ